MGKLRRDILMQAKPTMKQILTLMQAVGIGKLTMWWNNFSGETPLYRLIKNILEANFISSGWPISKARVQEMFKLSPFFKS